MQHRSRIDQAGVKKTAQASKMSRQLLGFIDDTKAWQANLIDSLYENNWQPRSSHDVELFSTQLYHGARSDQERLNQQRLYALLRFDEIADRHEAIPEAHQRTFEWVFSTASLPKQAFRPTIDDSELITSLQWSNFTDWLNGDRNLYWITGKPGSGKSTLMKYLFNDRRTVSAANTWNKTNELISCGFFFWNSGTIMQMSRMGLLQTLLHQCLRNREDLIPELFPNRWSRQKLFGSDTRPWTWSELSSALRTLVSRKDLSFLVFIDGLDEFDGNPQGLVSLVLDLPKVAAGRMKLCVASRPWLVFEESFQEIPSLRMEDLTWGDIQLYVEENMRRSSRWNELQLYMPEESSKITSEITDKAVGVFLWVRLVVTSLLDGLRDGDTIDDLWQRIGELPSTLEELFQKILKGLSPEYFIQGCEMFQLAVTAADPLTLLDLSLALENPKTAIGAPVRMLDASELQFRAETMRRRVISRSKGLLETPTAASSKHNAKVGYLHRTVKDFFKSTDAWEYIRAGAPKFDASLMLALSFLRQVKISGSGMKFEACIWDHFWRSFANCIHHTRGVQRNDTGLAIAIIDVLKLAGDEYWQDQWSSNTLFEKLVKTSTTRTTRDDWINIIAQCPMEGISTGTFRPERQLPHWVNSVHLANIYNRDIGHELQGRHAHSSSARLLSLQSFTK